MKLHALCLLCPSCAVLALPIMRYFALAPARRPHRPDPCIRFALQYNKDTKQIFLFCSAPLQDDPTDQIFVFYPDEVKVGVKTIKQLAERMRNEGVQRAVMVVQTNMTPFAKQCLQEMQPKYYIELVGRVAGGGRRGEGGGGEGETRVGEGGEGLEGGQQQGERRKSLGGGRSRSGSTVGRSIMGHCMGGIRVCCSVLLPGVAAGCCTCCAGPCFAVTTAFADSL